MTTLVITCVHGQNLFPSGKDQNGNLWLNHDNISSLETAQLRSFSAREKTNIAVRVLTIQYFVTLTRIVYI